MKSGVRLLIIDRDWPEAMRLCLDSLEKQTVKPDEVIIKKNDVLELETDFLNTIIITSDCILTPHFISDHVKSMRNGRSKPNNIIKLTKEKTCDAIISGRLELDFFDFDMPVSLLFQRLRPRLAFRLWSLRTAQS